MVWNISTERLNQNNTERSTHSLLHVGDKVVPVLGLLQTGKGHLGTRDVLSVSPCAHTTSDVGVNGVGDLKRTFLGFSRYSNMVWVPHSTPLLMLAAV